MTEASKFLIYCIERYRYIKNLPGAEVEELFRKYKVSDYIMEFHESLHCMGDLAIIEDIDEFISVRKDK